MAAATQQQQQQVTTTKLSSEEEALKRNTDCVYFLASPLTCKKGSECEYRHSEYARVNPRDCYYWLNGNCLNPKCGFRHPPLDGLFGSQAVTPTGSSAPKLHMAAAPALPTSQNPGKQAVPCIFFQKGLCLKGDKCAFSHGPSPASNKPSLPVVPSSSSEHPPQRKTYGGPQKFMQDQKIPQASFSKTVEASAEAKPAGKPEYASHRNGEVEKNLPSSKSIDGVVPKYKATNLHAGVNGNSSRFDRLHQSQVPEDQSFQNDQYGRTTGHEGRSLNPMDEYDRGHSADYGPVDDIDREAYRDPRGYDSYKRMQGRYAWDQRRSSSERMALGPAHPERGVYSKADSPEHADDVDLRYRLSKHRRVDGLRSVVSHDVIHDNHAEERGYRSSSRGNSHNISSRLLGRLKLPGRSSDEIRSEREVEKGRSRNRLSPGRSQIPSHQGKLRDRMKARMGDDYDNERRSLTGNRTGREMPDDRNPGFSGPKSLSELKGVLNTEGMTQQSIRKRKYLDGHQPSEGDLSFEGPMPLSEILKRKREAGGAGSGSGNSSSNKDDINRREIKATVAETEDEADRRVVKDEVSKSVENAEVVDNEHYSSQLRNPSEPETEDGMIVDDGVEEYQEYEGDDHGEGEYEYEQGDEGEYYEEGENVEGGEEYVEDEEGDVVGEGDGDGDDFAKKIGVMFS
ncbi:zinc finger CCCH domain-containing protein 17 isoform X2 [Mercurialis annua]|uniref:zinc finger CCCH domain-containing protein 17 isoform X2 n=1 Tax=Mercurialis annua TaxID=3986 RepID=UPI00215F123A|nr:zinc finger CCCH domain-containing protein 17 isoform X2 [Mercurialis annua]